MIKDYLNSVVEDKSSKDFIIFSSILFSLGFNFGSDICFEF